MRRPVIPILVLTLVALSAIVMLASPVVDHVVPLRFWTPLEPAWVMRALTGIERAREADAQETLSFRTVPPESVTIIEKRDRAARRARAHAVPVPPTPPADNGAPSAPEPPDVNPNPHVVVGKSGDLMRVGSDIHIGPDEVVRGDVSAIGGDVTVEGHVEGDVTSMGGDVYLKPSARVDGDVVCVGGQLHEDPGAVVGGQRVTALGGRHGQRVEEMRNHYRAERHAGHAVGAVIFFLLILGVSYLIASLAPGRTQAALDTLKHDPLISFGIGALIWACVIPSVIALALVVAILCITIIGIPLALAALLGYGLFLLVVAVWGFVVGVAGFGDLILRRREAGVPPLGRAVLWGVITICGLGFLGSILGNTESIGPLRALGAFMMVLAIVVQSVAATAGGGAWVRSEFATGQFGKWWARYRTPRAPAGGPPPPPPAPPAPPAPPTSSAPPPTTWAPPEPPPPTVGS